MSKTLRATYDGTVLRPDDPMPWKSGTRVILSVVRVEKDEPPDSVSPDAAPETSTAPGEDQPGAWLRRVDDYVYGAARP